MKNSFKTHTSPSISDLEIGNEKQPTLYSNGTQLKFKTYPLLSLFK